MGFFCVGSASDSLSHLSGARKLWRQESATTGRLLKHLEIWREIQKTTWRRTEKHEFSEEVKQKRIKMAEKTLSESFSSSCDFFNLRQNLLSTFFFMRFFFTEFSCHLLLLRALNYYCLLLSLLLFYTQP